MLSAPWPVEKGNRVSCVPEAGLPAGQTVEACARDRNEDGITPDA